MQVTTLPPGDMERRVVKSKHMKEQICRNNAAYLAGEMSWAVCAQRNENLRREAPTIYEAVIFLPDGTMQIHACGSERGAKIKANNRNSRHLAVRTIRFERKATNKYFIRYGQHDCFTRTSHRELVRILRMKYESISGVAV